MRILLQTTVLLLFTACLHSCRSTGQKPDPAEAILASPAFAHITDSIRLSPANPTLYFDRGARLTQQNFHELASADYEKAWKLRPDEPTALAYTSSLLLSRQEEEAVNLLQQCVRSFPASKEFARRLSEIYVQNGSNHEAMDLYSRMIETDSLNFDAWYQKGLLLVQLRDTAYAITCFENAYQLQPQQLYGFSLADLYAETRNAKAIQVCNELIGTDSLQRSTEAMYIKGIYYSNMHQYDQALQQYETCIRKDWKFTEAYIKKGIILFDQQNIDEALNTFAIAAKISVTYPDAYYWMGRCYEKIGKLQDARDSYKRALALNRNYPDAEDALKRMK